LKIVLGKFVIYEMTYFTFHFPKKTERQKERKSFTFFLSGMDDIRGRKSHGAESKHSSSGSETSSSSRNNQQQVNVF
jgi:hypothetical protein